MTIKITIESKLSHLPILRKAIEGICSSIVTKTQILEDINLSLNEAMANIITHAYKNEAGNEIQITVNLSSNEIEFNIVDSGKENRQKNTRLPDADLDSTDTISESGRGLYLIHKLMDEVIYKRENNKNVLLLRKKI